jgi:competence protein ComEC
MRALRRGLGGRIVKWFRITRHCLAAALAACLLLAVPPRAVAQEAPAAADRFAQVFDRSADPGRLTARFIKMSLATKDEGKSGDCTILISPDGKVMLVDAGAPECAWQIMRCLDAMGITRIDAVLASHPHVDHIGGLARIVEKYPVGKLYASRVEYPTSAFRDAMAAVRLKGIEVVYLEEGSAFSFGELVKAEVFNPEPGIRYYAGYPDNGTMFVNDRSLVVKFSYGASSMLFMGDAYASREAELMRRYGDRLKADVIKVGHHGSDTSSGKAFVRLVSPKIAVMMHDALASLQVYKNYRKAGAAVYLSSIDGSVRVSGDDAGNWTVLAQLDRLSDFLN